MHVARVASSGVRPITQRDETPPRDRGSRECDERNRPYGIDSGIRSSGGYTFSFKIV